MPPQNNEFSVSHIYRTQGTADYCSSLQSKMSAMRLFGDSKATSLSDFGCKLSIATLSAVTKIAESDLTANSRSSAKIALARQTAMYLAHTKFGLTYQEVGSFFQRDRSTVAHACHLVEDKRDNYEFDHSLCRMENLLDIALLGSSFVHDFKTMTKSGDRI